MSTSRLDDPAPAPVEYPSAEHAAMAAEPIRQRDARRRAERKAALAAPEVPVIMPLPPGAYSCAVCGIPVADPAPEEVITLDALGRLPSPGVVAPRNAQVPVRLQFARCPSCITVRDEARALLAAHPRVERTLGSRHHAEYRVENALIACALLGMSPSWIVSDALLLLAIEYLSVAGGRARWSSAFVPFTASDHGYETCTSRRFADVTPEARALADEGLRAVFRQRTDRAVVIEHPEGSGCAVCGVDRVEVLASRRDEAWTRRSAPRAAVGGTRGPGSIDITVCIACDRAAVAVGSIGATAFATALLDYADPSGHAARSLAMPAESMSVVPWIALSPRQEPSSEPWAWVDTDDLRGTLGVR